MAVEMQKGTLPIGFEHLGLSKIDSCSNSLEMQKVTIFRRRENHRIEPGRDLTIAGRGGESHRIEPDLRQSLQGLLRGEPEEGNFRVVASKIRVRFWVAFKPPLGFSNK